MGAMDVTLQRRFIENVNHLLEEKGLSRSDLSRRMGAAPQFVTSYLNGQRSPGLDVIARFSEALEVDASTLLAEPVSV